MEAALRAPAVVCFLDCPSCRILGDDCELCEGHGTVNHVKATEWLMAARANSYLPPRDLAEVEAAFEVVGGVL